MILNLLLITIISASDEYTNWQKNIQSANCWNSSLWDDVYGAARNSSADLDGIKRFVDRIMIPNDPSRALECPLGIASLLFRLGHREALFLAKMFVLHVYNDLGVEGIKETRWPLDIFEIVTRIRDLGTFKKLNLHVVSYCDYHPSNLLTMYSRMNKLRYTAERGYNLTHLEAPLNHTANPWTNKMLSIRKVLAGNKDSHWILWMDCDAIFMNHNVVVEDIIGSINGGSDKQLIMSEDANMLNSAVMFFRNSEWSRRFVDQVIGLMQVPGLFSFRDNIYHEQSVIMYLVTEMAGGYIPEMALLPQKLINAYPPEIAFRSDFMHHAGYSEGDWIVSFNGCISFFESSECLEMMKHYFNTSF
jgi:hypothetical protein